MELPFADKHLYILMTENQGIALDPIRLSIQDVVFKKNGQYEVSCLAANNNQMIRDEIRLGKYSIKEQSDKHIVLICDEETGQFKGKYEVTIDMLSDDTAKTHVKALSGNGGFINGIFKIAAA